MSEIQDKTTLLRRAKDGDESATALLVEQNTGLIKSVLRRFNGRGFETEDLFQIGAIGLIKAIRRFDLSFDVQFSTYAVPMIMGEIKRYIRDDGIIKVSRSLKELSIKASSVREALIRENGEEPTVSEIAKQIGVSPEEVAAAFEATARPESLYTKSGDGDKDGQALIDRLESPQSLEKITVDKLLITSLLKEFPQREQKIIILRYFRQKTQSQIADLLGISQVQVSRLEKKILSKMREKLEE